MALFLPALAVGSRRKEILAVLAGALLLQYAVLASEGPTQLAVCQEAIRNSRNAAPWQDRITLARWLADHPPKGLVLMNAGDLGPVIPASGLTFRRVVHEGTHEWNEWLATGVLPSEVTNIVFRSGDEMSSRMRATASEGFEQVYTCGDLVVLERTPANR